MKACATCASFYACCLRSKVSMPDEHLVFNLTLSLDLMFLDGRAVLHVVGSLLGSGTVHSLSVKALRTSGLR